MKKLLLISLLATTVIFSACNPNYKALQLNKPFRNFVELEEGSGVYFNKYETTNAEYRLFLNAIESDSQINWKTLYLDTTQWVKIVGIEKLNMPKLYHWHPAYRHFPTVNVTLDGAIEYCNWLTSEYNSSRRRNAKKIIFRLPKNIELEQLLHSTNVEYNSDSCCDYEELNFNLAYVDNLDCDGALITGPVFYYPQNKEGICSIIGQVSELTESGEAYGGNWHSLPSEVDSIITFKAPDPRIGFRIILEVLED